ncbi:MAG: RNA polymerase sigma factor [Dehalococcoidia bacterium]
MTLAAAANDTAAPLSDEALVLAARERPADFGLLYERYLPRVYRYLVARTGLRDEAADLTQTAFLKAFDALPHYAPRKGTFAAWLFRIARNAAADAHRKRRPTVAWDGLPEALTATNGASPEAIAEKRERLDRLRHLLLGVDADKRELLALRFASDLSSREIAHVVGKSESAVKKQLTRTIATLKEYYHDELP